MHARINTRTGMTFFALNFIFPNPLHVFGMADGCLRCASDDNDIDGIYLINGITIDE